LVGASELQRVALMAERKVALKDQTKAYMMVD
jgi:hypothetical protein